MNLNKIVHTNKNMNHIYNLNLTNFLYDAWTRNHLNYIDTRTTSLI